jgi:FkbM family methyltransferase
MTLSTLRRIFRRAKSILKKKPDDFLRDVSGVIHVGANTGQERKLYEMLGLCVIWIEPIPEVYEILKANLEREGFLNQRTFQCLITDCDDAEYRFHISNNEGASSSILELKMHKDIWPEVNYTTTISLRSSTLASLLRREHIDLSEYQALIIDTQGSELLVLKGVIPLLHNFKYVQIEVADFESYAGCCQLDELSSFMAEHGYSEYSCHKLVQRPKVGSYYDIIYKREV